MKRSTSGRVAIILLLCALAMSLGAADEACPPSALATDSITVETEYGSFTIDVCVVRDAATSEDIYTLTVTNLDLDCPIQSFGIRPIAGVAAQLEPSDAWSPANEEPHWWIWDAPAWAAIRKDESRSFSFRIPGTSEPYPISGAAFLSPLSSCGGTELAFGVLGATEASGAIARQAFSSLCTCGGASGALEVAEQITVPRGYRAEYLVAPSGLNVPSDVAISPNSEIFVTSSRAGTIYRVTLDGSIRQFASSHAYAIDADAAGRIYGYNFPDRKVLAFGASGKVEILARLPETACESSLAAAPDGTLYIAYNYCAGDEMGGATVYRLRPDSRVPEAIYVEKGFTNINAVDVAGDGSVYIVRDERELCTVDVERGQVHRLTTLSFRVSFHGLAVASDGSIYLSQGGMTAQGAVYRYLPDEDTIRKIAAFDGNGIQGIEVLEDGSLVGVQRAIGGFQRIYPNGVTSPIVRPNGLVSPQSITATPCGELVVVNDEAGWAAIVCPNGTVKPFVAMNSFMPPLTHVASTPDGSIIAGESAPGFPSHLVKYSRSGSSVILAADIHDVSGVAVAADGTIYAAATRENRIYVLSPDGARDVLTTDVRKPQALALSEDGRLFAVVNRNTTDPLESSAYGDAIVEILSNGAVRLIAEVPWCTDLVLDDAGTIYVATEESVWRITASGSRSVLASGFEGARGLTLLDGNLYVTDDAANAIIRIVYVGGDEPGDTEEESEKEVEIP